MALPPCFLNFPASKQISWMVKPLPFFVEGGRCGCSGLWQSFTQFKRNDYLVQQDARTGHPVPATCSDAVKPHTPRKLRRADTGSLQKTPYGAAVAAAFPHRRFTTPTAASGIPRSSAGLAEQHSRGRAPGQQPQLLALARPRAAGAGGYLSSLPGRRGDRHQHWGSVGQSRRQGLGPALAVGSKGGRPPPPRCREEPLGFGRSHGHKPRSAPSGSGHSTDTPAPLCATASSGFLKLCEGNSAQEFARHGTFPQLSASRVTPSARCSSSGRSDPAPHQHSLHRGRAAAGHGRARGSSAV